LYLSHPAERSVRQGGGDARRHADDDDETGGPTDPPATATAITFVERAR
jgi:hypothetical protein